MGTYYVDNDVGPTGGSGTQQDPYGIETAIAAAQAGDVFYWRGGGEGDVSPGHTLNFNNGGTHAAPVHWIGTDDDWVPILPGQMPHTGVDGNDGAYTLVGISAAHQIFENIRISNAFQGRNGNVIGCSITALRIIVRNCVVHDCASGFLSSQRGHVFAQCRVYDVSVGFSFNYFGALCYACTVNDTESHAFEATGGACFSACRVYGIGGNGVELYRDAEPMPIALKVDHLSAYDCVHGVNINSYSGNCANTFAVTSSVFDTCSGYAVNVTAPAGQMGFIANNGSRNCTSGQVPSGRPGLINENWIALPACPFVDAASGDLSLVRGTPAIGAGLDGGDLGALQRRFARLPYPVMGLT